MAAAFVNKEHRALRQCIFCFSLKNKTLQSDGTRFIIKKQISDGGNMKSERPYAWTVEILRRAHLRPTCQRMGLVKLLFGNGNRHICAEDLYKEARKKSMSLSLATVYNTLNQFKESGLLQEILTGSGKTYYDTNLTPHYHVFRERDGIVEDVPDSMITVSLADEFLMKNSVKSIDVIVRM